MKPSFFDLARKPANTGRCNSIDSPSEPHVYRKEMKC